MKTRISRSSLKEAVSGFNKVIAGKSTIPVLGCVRLDAGKDGIVAQATNLDEVVEYRFDGAEVRGEGGCIIPLSTLKDLAKGSKDETVEIEVDNPLAISVINNIGNNAVRKPVDGMDLDEWPAMHVQVATKPADGFLETYRRLLPFASTDETRYVLNGVYVDTAGKGTRPTSLIATNGRVLGLWNSMSLPLQSPIIIPRSKFLAGAKLPAETAIGVHDNDGVVWFGMKAGAWRCCIKTIDGTYPNYRQVIPAEPGEHVITFTDGDVDLLKQVLPTFPGDEDITVVGDDGKVTLYGRGPDDTDWTTLTLDASSFKGDRVFIGVNRTYLLDALAAGFREFAINDEFSPMLSQDGKGGTHVLMPMRVQDPVDTEAEETVHPAADTAGVVPDQPVEQPVVEKHDAKPEPVAKKPTTRRTKVPKNEQKNETPALDRVLTACDAARTKVKEAGQALSELATAIKDAARDQRGQSRDVEAARAALSKLQAISL